MQDNIDIEQSGIVLDNIDRTKQGRRACVIGVAMNAVLFVGKLIVGINSGSLAIVSDSINSLSDSAVGIVNLFGFHIAGKPADRDHPFGHGRIEYIVSLIISGVIILIGIEFLRSSVGRIITPKPLYFSIYMMYILFASIAGKILLYFYYRKVSRKISSESLSAASVDSFSDVAITSVTVVALLLFAKFGIIIDGYIGVVVSLFVLYAGFTVGRNAVQPLIGIKTDPRLIRIITDVFASDPHVLGVHDVVVHDYGPGRFLASAHVEIDSRMSLLDAHIIIDKLEKEVVTRMNIPVTVHADPVDIEDSMASEIRKCAENAAEDLSPGNRIHDFRVVRNVSGMEIEFEIDPDQNMQISDDEISVIILERLQAKYPQIVRVNIHPDRNYFSACK